MKNTMIDYSQKANWYKVPEITKDIDTFYIYSTVYFGIGEGDPNYATLDNAEMLAGIEVEYAIKTKAFEDSTNVFVPYYRQVGMKYAGETWMKTGDVRTVFCGMPYEDASENLGSLVMDLQTGATEIRDIGADAQVNLARGTVVTNADAIPNEMEDYAGPQNYHQDDYSIYFNNVKDNVAKRIAAYKANR